MSCFIEKSCTIFVHIVHVSVIFVSKLMIIPNNSDQINDVHVFIVLMSCVMIPLLVLHQ